MNVHAVRDAIRRGGTVTGEAVQHNPYEAVAQISNAVARPGPLTTEWWSVIVGGTVSSVLAAVGLPGSSAAQVAGIIAPVALALVYAFVRTRHKGALADALQAVFPQAVAAAQATSSGESQAQTSDSASAPVVEPEPLALGAGPGPPIAAAPTPVSAEPAPAPH